MLEPLKFRDYTIAVGKNFEGRVRTPLYGGSCEHVRVEELISLDGWNRNLLKRTFSPSCQASAYATCLDPGNYLISNKTSLVIDDSFSKDNTCIIAYGDVVINKEIELDILFVKGNLKVNADIKVKVLLVEGATNCKKGTTLHLQKFATSEFKADKIILYSDGRESFVEGSFTVNFLTKEPATPRDHNRYYIRVTDDFVCQELAMPCYLDSGNVKVSKITEITDAIEENYITIKAGFSDIELGPNVHIGGVGCKNLKVGKDSYIGYINCEDSLEAEGNLEAEVISVEEDFSVTNGYAKAYSINVGGNIKGEVRKKKKKSKSYFYY